MGRMKEGNGRRETGKDRERLRKKVVVVVEKGEGR